MNAPTEINRSFRRKQRTGLSLCWAYELSSDSVIEILNRNHFGTAHDDLCLMHYLEQNGGDSWLGEALPSACKIVLLGDEQSPEYMWRVVGPKVRE